MDHIRELFKTSGWLQHVGQGRSCVGGCGKTDRTMKMFYKGEKRNLCYDCFIDKNEELSRRYTLIVLN